jgi:hypothetical protein
VAAAYKARTDFADDLLKDHEGFFLLLDQDDYDDEAEHEAARSTLRRGKCKDFWKLFDYDIDVTSLLPARIRGRLVRAYSVK